MHEKNLKSEWGGCLRAINSKGEIVNAADDLNQRERMKNRNFLMPREGFLDFAVEFTNKFFPGEDKKLSIKDVNDFINEFCKKHFMDDFDEE